MHRLAHSAPALAAALLLASPARGTAQSRDDDQREAPEVRAVRFRGVKAMDKGELKNSVATEASRCISLLVQPFCWVSHAKYFYKKNYLDRTELKRDVLRIRVFYFKRGYRETTVDTTVAERGETGRAGQGAYEAEHRSGE